MQSKMRTIWGVIACLLAWLCASIGWAESRLSILSLEQSMSPSEVLLTLSFDRPASARVFTLQSPRRLVIDLPAFEWVGPPPERKAPVAEIRYGLFQPDTGRIVMELDRPVQVRRQPAPDAGLAIALIPSSEAVFAQTAGWPDDARWQGVENSTAPRSDGIIVAVDPGHGGIDPGAAAEGLVEKHIVLDFSHLLVAEIEKVPGLSAFLTRDDDRFLPLRERVRIARAGGAHVLLSIHADSLASGIADGASLYTLSSQGSDAATKAFAERENRADVLAGVNLSGNEDDVTRLLIDLARRGTTDESVKLADAIIDALSGDIDLLDTRPHRRGNFFVLKAPDLPSVLVELGFLTSARDRALLTDPVWQAKMARGMVRGIRRWTETASPGFLEPR